MNALLSGADRLLADWLKAIRRGPDIRFQSLHLLVPFTEERPVGRVLHRVLHSRRGGIDKVIPDVPIDRFLEVQDRLLSIAGIASGESVFDRYVELPDGTGGIVPARLSMTPYRSRNGSVCYAASIRMPPHGVTVH